MNAVGSWSIWDVFRILVEVRKYFWTSGLLGKFSRGRVWVESASRLGHLSEALLVEHVSGIPLSFSFVRNGSERLMSASSGIMVVDWAIWNCLVGTLSRCMIGHK